MKTLTRITFDKWGYSIHEFCEEGAFCVWPKLPDPPSLADRTIRGRRGRIRFYREEGMHDKADLLQYGESMSSEDFRNYIKTGE